MHALRRFLLAAVLTGLVVGCQRKGPPGRSEDTPPPAEANASPALQQSNSLKEKIRKAEEAAKEIEDKGPRLHP
jgi:hypothetical protein